MAKLQKIIVYLKARLAEPSTLASIAVVLTLAGIHIDAGTMQAILSVATLIFSIAGILVAG